MLGHELAQPPQKLSPLVRAHVAPLRILERRPCGTHGRIDLLRPCLLDLRDRLFGSGIDRGEPVRTIAPLPPDQQLGTQLHDRLLPCELGLAALDVGSQAFFRVGPLKEQLLELALDRQALREGDFDPAAHGALDPSDGA